VTLARRNGRPDVSLAESAGERHVWTIAKITFAKKINGCYVGRVLRLKLLSPDVVEAILGER
jgi:hypothetical protein